MARGCRRRRQLLEWIMTGYWIRNSWKLGKDHLPRLGLEE